MNRLLVLAGGKFKETNFGAVAEAVINLGMSLLLITKFGLIGVAVGTLAAIAFRLIYLVWYLHKQSGFRWKNHRIHDLRCQGFTKCSCT